MRLNLRRSLIIGTVLCAVAAALGAGHAWERHRQPPPSRVASRRPHAPVGRIYGIAPNLYVVPGGGGNTAVFVTSHGVLLVDTKYADRYDAMIAQVRTVTDKPITHVVNTHCHGDHMGGNQFLAPGVEIVVQENTARNMEEMRRSWDPKNEHAHPLRTFARQMTLFDGEDAVDLYYFGPGHTDGDTFVVFRAARVMHTGDLFPAKAAPIVNIAWGGNGLTYPDTIAGAAARIENVDYVIPGHGPVSLFSDFVEFGEFTRLLRDHARTTPRSGDNPENLIKELQLPDRFTHYDLGRISSTMDEIYTGLAPQPANARGNGSVANSLD